MLAEIQAPDGHNSFNIQLETNSFDSLEKNIVVQHPDWTSEQQRHQALILFNTLMFPKQVKSFIAEKQGSQEMPVDEGYDVINGKLIHPLYGEFDRMIDNARTLEERESLVLYQETMVKASPGTRVVTLDLHAAPDGQHAVRYADISYKGLDGKVYIEKRVDISGDRNALNLTESWDKLQTLAREGRGRTLISDRVPQVGIVVVAPNEVITTERLTQDLHEKRDLPNGENEVVTTPGIEKFGTEANDKADEVLETSKYRDRVVESIVDDFSAINKHVLVNTMSTFSTVRTYTKDKLERKIEPVRTKDNKPHIVRRFIDNVAQRAKEIRMQVKPINQRVLENKASYRPMGFSYSGKIETNLSSIVKRHQEARQIKPEKRKKLSRIGDRRIIVDKTVEPGYRREKAKKIVDFLRKKENQKAILIKSKELKKLVKREYKEQSRRLSLETVPKKRKKKLLRQLRRWFKVLEITQKTRFQKEKSQLRLSLKGQKETIEKTAGVLVRQEKQLRLKEAVAKLAIAWIFWRGLVNEKQVRWQIQLPEKKIWTETINEPEPRQWLILSIIWSLAAVREQGRRNKQINKYANKQIKKQKPAIGRLTFPPQGIIFSLYS